MKRRRKRVWIGPGTVMGVTESDCRKRVIAALVDLSKFTLTDFEITTTRNRGQVKIEFKTAVEIKKRWRGNGVPMGIAFGQNIWIVSDRPRFGTPEQKLIERLTWHEFGHTIGQRHSKDEASIMNVNLNATELNANDRIAFQKRLGKPK